MGGEASFEPRPDSPFRVRFSRFDTVVEGRVLEVVEDERIAFTWGVSEGRQAEWMPAGSTRVEIRLAADGDGTRVTIEHAGLPTDEEVSQHTAGWRFHLGRLSVIANRAELTEALRETTEEWFEAWNERDPEARARRLAACCEEAVAFRDDYASLEGRERLAAHIGTAHDHMPGSRVERDGDPSICRGEALIPWRIVGEDGEVAFRGINHARVSPTGRLRKVTGFWWA